MKNLVVLASGRGSNFAAIADAIRDGKITGARVGALISNNAEANVLRLAGERGIPAEVVNWKSFGRGPAFDRAAYERVLVEKVRALKPDLICLAGYTLLLGPGMVSAFPERMVNIHPSLLPAFKGLRAQKQALEYGVRWTGCTVHFVDADLDAGPIIAQSTIAIRDDDTEESLSARLLPIEHATYIEAIQRLCARPYRRDGRRIFT